MKQFKRADRLSQQILRVVSTVLEVELAELGHGMVTFTSCRMTDQLRSAKVYYSFMGTDEKRDLIQGYLFAKRGQIRSRVGKELHIRHIPELEFEFDPSVEEGMRIEQLLHEIKDNRNDGDKDN